MLNIKEGDFVMGSTKEGIVHGMVEHIMIEGGTLGTPGTEYAIESMIPDNPAMSVRIYEEEDGKWEPTAYSIGMMYQDAQIADINNHNMESEDMDSEVGMAMFDAQMGKADDSMMPTETYQSNKQAPCWDGYVQRGMKPGENGRPVPNCVPAAKADDLWEDDDTVEYETDSIMWLAWGGDAGFSWSRRIVESERNKSLFADFGKDYTRSTTNVFRTEE